MIDSGLSSDQKLLVHGAELIGHRLIRSAIWSGNACTWTVLEADPGSRGDLQLRPVPANGLVYAGTAGIAIFLAELMRIRPDDKLKRTLEGALRFAIQDASRLSDSACGMFAGRVGIAFACTQAARVGCTEFVDVAWQVVKSLDAHIESDTSLDIVGGPAGAIPALLNMSRWLDEPNYAAFATRMADRICLTAHVDRRGASWGGRAPGVVRDLLGYAHGASGMAHGLLEAYAATGFDDFSTVARSALAYEHSYFDSEKGNWPDFRNIEIANLLTEDRGDEILDRIDRGEDLHLPVRTAMVAWCHGAAGIGPVRARAFDVLGNTEYHDQALVAFNSTLASLQRQGLGFSLCHGYLGNAVSLLSISRALNIPSTRAELCAKAAGWVEEFEVSRGSWPSGIAHRAYDPTLMRGDAGIGHALIQLADLRAESILCQQYLGDRDPSLAPGEPQFQRRIVGKYFISSRRICSALDDEYPIERSDSAPATTILASAFDRLVQNIEIERVRIGEQTLRVASRTDLARYAVAMVDVDMVAEKLSELRWSTGRLDEYVFSVSPSAILVERAESDESSSDTVVVFRDGHDIREMRLSALGAVLLRSLHQPQSLDELTKSALEFVEDVEFNVLRAIISRQLARWRGAAFLRVGVGSPGPRNV